MFLYDSSEFAFLQLSGSAGPTFGGKPKWESPCNQVETTGKPNPHARLWSEVLIQTGVDRKAGKEPKGSFSRKIEKI